MKEFFGRKIKVCALLVSLLMALPFSAMAESWTVNLRDADIRAFVNQVADITGETFIVDPRVKGEVTVLSSGPLESEAVYELFLSVLQVHGQVAIKDGNVIKIIPQAEAKQEGGAIEGGDSVGHSDLVTRVIHLEHANALELIPLMRPLVARHGHLAGVSDANAIIISDHKSNVERISDLIADLDEEKEVKTEVVELKEAWVGDLVPIIQALLKNDEDKKHVDQLSISADERSNRLILRGSLDQIEHVKTLIEELDHPSATGQATKVIQLKHADSAELETLIKEIMGADKESNEGNREFTVYADQSINALVVKGDPSEVKEAEAIVSQLDIRRAQVMIEAAIVEISDEAGESIGVQMGAGDESSGSVPLTATNFSNTGVSLNSILGAIVGTQIPMLADGGTFGIGGSDNNGLTWGVLLQAISTSSSANLLSTPSIITLDNHESEIVVGQNVPFRTGETGTVAGGVSNPFTTIERRDVGLMLKVKPSISDNGLVKMVVEQSTENVAPSIDNASDIVTNKREIKTTVLADDGETIVLGGLVKDDVVKSTSKVPLLGDIPLLGKLFQSETEKRVKRNLLVFLKPTIMRDKVQGIRVTQEKYETLKEVDLKGFMD